MNFTTFASIILIFGCIQYLGHACIPGCKCSAAFSTCNLRSFLSSVPSGLPTNIVALVIIGTDNHPNTFGRLSSSAISSPSLKHLTMKYCGINGIDNGAFQSLVALKSLVLSYNKLLTIQQSTFQGISGLTQLDLSGNENCHIDTNALVGLRQLQELHLAELNMETLSGDILKPLSSLKVLDLHGNELKTFDWSVLKSFSALKHLDISDNQLTTLPADIEPVFSRLQAVKLEDNPWRCDWDTKWLKHSKLPFSDRSKIICDAPDELKYLSIINVPDKKLDPILPKVLKCAKDVVIVKEGSPANINCAIEGKPLSSISWTGPLGTVFEPRGSVAGHKAFQNGSFYIDSVSGSESGNWTLIVGSKFGEDQKVIRINVIRSTTISTSTTTTMKTTTTPLLTTTTTTKPSVRLKTTQIPMVVHTVILSNIPTNTTVTEKPNMLMFYAAGGGGGLLLMIIIIIICCKVCKKGGAVNDRQFDSVKTPRNVTKSKPTRVNVAPRHQAYN